MEKAGWCYKFRFYQRCHRCRIRSASWIFVKTKPKFIFSSDKKYQSIKKKVMSTHATLPTPKKPQFGWILQCIRLVRRFSPPVFHEERRGSPSSFAWLLLLETSREKWWWLRDGRLFEASTGIFGTWLPFTCSTTNIQVVPNIPWQLVNFVFVQVCLCVVFNWWLVCKVSQKSLDILSP